MGSCITWDTHTGVGVVWISWKTSRTVFTRAVQTWRLERNNAAMISKCHGEIAGDVLKDFVHVSLNKLECGMCAIGYSGVIDYYMA